MTDGSLQRGTTSACAENTPALVLFGNHAGNYLRVRGEYPMETDGEEIYMELPPRARRIPSSWRIISMMEGTTSACAENTVVFVVFEVFVQNYLRVRGEYKCSIVTFEWLLELPPRARRIRACRIPSAAA